MGNKWSISLLLIFFLWQHQKFCHVILRKVTCREMSRLYMYHLFPLYHSRILKNLNTLHICRVRLLQQGESQAVGAVSLTIQSCNFNLMPYNSCLYTTESSRHILLCLCRCSDGYGNHKKFALKSAKTKLYDQKSWVRYYLYLPKLPIFWLFHFSTLI